MSHGLTAQEAAARFASHGPNELSAKKRLTGIVEFFVRFKNPLIIILLFAAGIEFFVGEIVSAVLIIVMVVLSIVIDFTNTYRSERAAEALRDRVKITATVVRDGVSSELPLREIVPGDVVLLTPGDIIPADGKLTDGRDFFVNESALTGESFPAEKQQGGEVFMGSSVVSGSGEMVVELTGRDTKFGKVAISLTGADGPTEFERSIKDFSYLIMKIIFVLVIFVFFVNAFSRPNILESFLFAAALAVGLTPELLPMIIAINLAKGSIVMAKHGVIVKRPASIQNFGSMDVFCTDKTGTLTEDKIILVKSVDGAGMASETVFQYAYISSMYHSGFVNPLDTAIKDHKQLDISAYKKIDEIPFDFVRRRDSVVVEKGGVRTLVSKGAPEEVMAIATTYGDEGTLLTDEVRSRAHVIYEQLSADGFRVLGIATKRITDIRDVYTKEYEEKLTFLGFMAFLDPPKESVQETLRQLHEYGVAVKIITGDNEFVTKNIAQAIKLPVEGVITGHELESLSDAALAARAESTTIFARITPDQKMRIITALRKNGHVVGYLGDGINDAPALKAADVGISVNNAVDVAKESADIILLNKSLKDLVNGIIEGRVIFGNTLKYFMMSLSSNFGNMFSMAGASLFLPFLPMLPVQVLFNNLLYDSSQLTIPTDRVEAEDIKRPRTLRMDFLKRFMLVFGPVSSLFDLLTFFIFLYVFHLTGASFQTGWFLESIATQAFVVYIIRTRRFSFSASRPSRALVASTTAAVIVALVVAESALGKFFGFQPLSIPLLGAITVIVLAYLFTVEIAKRWFYRAMARRVAHA
ncbi:MAG: magnesium-translocating P-type ATPase [Candidatus Yonathbacteria bacterium RIFCSPHIGHO2_01_FULL_51_10]|uniref:Magnesium-transporting ATPase, P-type 1 n=1 Tax=Candidatus Yonathbacteria bacterium RIFCSPHIGHO2_01_FULL_51_10 TaxID=1802723 RepID=A0A1G2SC84_9BACT|nr:MAG: magnesium-translocating P-type ATPase [Candidatus Yonathbacteria bacterium RIFCSPHIGHO2_01_FULL_51_10]